MSILDSSDGSILTGWTVVDPGANADVTVSSGTIRSWKSDAVYTDTLNTLGIYRTTPTAGASGHTIYLQVKAVGSGAFENMIVLSKSAQINYQNMFSAYMTGGNRITAFDGADGEKGSFAATSGNWYDLKFAIQSGGTVTLSARASDAPGAFNPNSSAWTLVYAGASATGYTSSSIYFAVNAGKAYADNPANGLFVDEFYYTSDGSILSAGGNSGGGSSTLLLLGDD